MYRPTVTAWNGIADDDWKFRSVQRPWLLTMLSKVGLLEVATAGPDSKVVEIVSCPNSGSSNQGSNGLWSIESCELAKDASCADEAEAALFGVEAFEDELFAVLPVEAADSVLEVPGSMSMPMLPG